MAWYRCYRVEPILQYFIEGTGVGPVVGHAAWMRPLELMPLPSPPFPAPLPMPSGQVMMNNDMMATTYDVSTYKVNGVYRIP